MCSSLKSKIIVLLTVITVILSGITTALAAGEIDPAFNAPVYGLNTGTINVLKKQPDGKILIGGTFIDVNGQATTGVARLNADGSVDASFSAPDFGNGNGVGGAVYAIGLQSNGKIIVGGDIYGVGGVFGRRIFRLNADGSFDPTFQSPLFDNSTAAIVYDLEVQPDNKIVAGGQFQIFTGGAANSLVRLNADGTVDSAFANFTTVGTIFALEIQADGRILTAGSQTLARRTADGSSDPTFGGVSTNAGQFTSLQTTADGKIFLGGSFSSLNGFAVGRIAKINQDSSIDLTFNQNGIGASGQVNDILVQPDGKIVIAGYFNAYNGTVRQKAARLNADGTLDESFVSNPQFSNLFATAIELFNDGRFLLGGGVQSGTAVPLMRLGADGFWDTTVNYVVSRTGKVREIIQQPDGKILIGGQFSAVGGAPRNSLARLNADGSVDQTFVPYFNNGEAQSVNALALQPDGKILIGGFGGVPLARLQPDGSLDSTFTPPTPLFGVIVDIALQPNGQVLVGGDAVDSAGKKIARLNANGSLDTFFAAGAQPNGTVYKIRLQPDGRVLIGGTFTQIGTAVRGRIARLNTDGSLDINFNPPGGANGAVYNLELQPDGKVILSGDFTSLNGSANQNKIGRLNADGSLDTSFAQTANAFIVGLKLQPDGKILIGGIFNLVGGTPSVGIARLNTNGSLDPTFNANAPFGANDFYLQPDGKILVGGDFVRINGTQRLRAARLLNTTATVRPLFDYDGDGKADVSVFRASENKWYVRQSTTALTTQTVFAVPDDIAVPADYDGDGKTDPAVFRPSNGDWWFLSSITGAQVNVHWGQLGDVPRPADFDGDGKADFVVYRPSNSVWYRFGSTGVTSIIPFGIAEDKPLVGDFDGDGKSDPAIFRPSTGDWWYAASSASNQHRTGHWGASGDLPAPADYDGDGKTDFAVYRPSNGGWYIVNSSNGSWTILGFGLAEDKPVPADYDGDGRADIAVFRPSTGTWYLMQTSLGFGALQFGVATDLPTEAAFLP